VADLQRLLDDMVIAAAEVCGPMVAGPHVADSALGDADSITKLSEALKAMTQFLDRIPRQHVANFRENDWVLEHPLECRRDDRPLSECPLNVALLDSTSRPNKQGRYMVTLQHHRLVLGARVAASGHLRQLGARLRPAGSEPEEAADGGEQVGDQAAKQQHRKET
jgi:hypothetical protein